MQEDAGGEGNLQAQEKKASVYSSNTYIGMTKEQVI
jgi:hypothetical protein